MAQTLKDVFEKLVIVVLASVPVIVLVTIYYLPKLMDME